MAQTNDDQFENGESEVTEKRHKVAIDTVSLISSDGESPSAEEHYIGQQMFFEIIRSLASEREKFIALGLFVSFQNQEIAFMLGVHPSRVTRNIQEIRAKLSDYAVRKARK